MYSQSLILIIEGKVRVCKYLWLTEAGSRRGGRKNGIFGCLVCILPWWLGEQNLLSGARAISQPEFANVTRVARLVPGQIILVECPNHVSAISVPLSYFKAPYTSITQKVASSASPGSQPAFRSFASSADMATLFRMNHRCKVCLIGVWGRSRWRPGGRVTSLQSKDVFPKRMIKI